MSLPAAAISLYLIPQPGRFGLPTKLCHVMMELYNIMYISQQKILDKPVTIMYRNRMLKTPNLETDMICTFLYIHSNYLAWMITI